MKIREFMTAGLCLLFAFSEICSAEEAKKKESISLEQAVRIADTPETRSIDMGTLFFVPSQIVKRLRNLAKYEYDEKDAETWLNCLRDSKKSIYAKLCAAYFLLDQHEEARTFITAQLKSENLRHRFNAATMIDLYVGENPENDWGINTLIGLLEDGSIDNIGSHTYFPILAGVLEEYPEGDQADITSPINDICQHMGSLKLIRAVPALITVLERIPNNSDAVDALGEIGDNRVAPLLMKRLHDRVDDNDAETIALGNLKYKGAVPALLKQLVNYEDDDYLGTVYTLEALLKIGDQQAVKPIEEYLQGDFQEENKGVARRVLVQLKSDDPVSELIKLLDSETDEMGRRRIIDDLAEYHDLRVVDPLEKIARTSDSAAIRSDAIYGLAEMGDGLSLLILAALLDQTWPDNLTTETGWKTIPDFKEYFSETVLDCLKRATQQDFGPDRDAWEEWINKNCVFPKSIDPAQQDWD